MDTIVVGVGEQRASDPAVQWAAAEADRRGWQLELLRALQYPASTGAGMGVWYPDDLLDELDALAIEELEDAHTSVSATYPSLTVRSSLEHTHPRLALTRASETARMVVTGARRRGSFPGALLGSTSMHVAAHARCPVAVVHSAPAPGARGVVVGHDGSPSAGEAVVLAAEEAHAAGEELLIVHAWFLEAVFPRGFDADRYLARVERQEAEQRRLLERVADAVRADRPGLVVRTELLVDEFASEALVSRALSARLLVVGSRGHGAFATMLLGSTSHHVLHNTRTPVVVVPDRVRVAGSVPLPARAEGPPAVRVAVPVLP